MFFELRKQFQEEKREFKDTIAAFQKENKDLKNELAAFKNDTENELKHIKQRETDISTTLENEIADVKKEIKYVTGYVGMSHIHW